MELTQLSRSHATMSTTFPDRDDDPRRCAPRHPERAHPQTRPSSASFDVREFASRFPFLVPEAVLTNLAVASKHEAILALVRSLAAHGVIPATEQEAIAAAVLQREALGSTGVGRGAALPHAQHPAVARVVGTVAYCPQGLEFDSLDGRPAHLLCLLLSPPARHNDQLFAFQALARELTKLECWC